MTSFRYVVQDQSGKTLKGLMSADDRSDVLTRLREKHHHVISIDAATTVDLMIHRILDRLTGIPRQSVVMFTRQLAALIRAGLPLAQALQSLALQERNRKFQAVIEVVYTKRQDLSRQAVRIHFK